jgi:hypothetical protein
MWQNILEVLQRGSPQMIVAGLQRALRDLQRLTRMDQREKSRCGQS